MDVAVDPKGRQRCVMEAFRERPNDQFAQAGVRRLLRLGPELFVRHLKMKPVSREGRDLRMDHLYLGALLESVAEELVVGEPRRREDGRVELSQQHDLHAADLGHYAHCPVPPVGVVAVGWPHRVP